MENLTIVDHPLVQHKLSLMRDRTTPTHAFRRLLREIAPLMLYEATRDLELRPQPISTPLCDMDAPVLAGKKLALISVLRAGNGMVDAMAEIVPSARIGFIGLYRDHETLEPVDYYLNLPEDLAQRPILIIDPMLATGNSAVAAVDHIKAAGGQNLRFISLLAAPEGVRRLSAAHPDMPILTAALDDKLDENGYILPGLGDAGDRIFGTKPGH